MKFGYDPCKAATNVQKHGVSFEEATLLWQSPNIQMMACTEGELRFIIIGRMNGKCYSCIYTKRGESIRLISARRSRKKEEELYYESI